MRAILVVCLATSTSIAAGPAWSATEPRIGTTASLEREVTGTLGSARRTLRLGDGIFQNEDIATGDAASAQLLFTDETALTLGPNSRVTLDKLVYDPATRQGELTLRATTGAFRFISGSAPKAGYKIDTPMGTIGVRGTIISFSINGPWLTLSLTEGGTVLCAKSGQCVELNKPGTYVVTNGSQIGDTKSKYDKSCGESLSNCKFGDSTDTLFLDFLGLKFFDGITPAAGPNLPPPNNPPPNPGNGPPPPPNDPPPTPSNGPPTPPTPPPGPPVQTGFPPIVTGAGTIPPGLQNRDTLPPGLANRGPTFLPPGQQNTPPGQLNTSPGQLRRH